MTKQQIRFLYSLPFPLKKEHSHSRDPIKTKIPKKASGPYRHDTPEEKNTVPSSGQDFPGKEIRMVTKNTK